MSQSVSPYFGVSIQAITNEGNVVSCSSAHLRLKRVREHSFFRPRKRDSGKFVCVRGFFIRFFDLFTFFPGLRKSASATPAFWLRLNVSLFFAVSALNETKRPSQSHGPKCVHFVHIFINSCYTKTPRSDYQMWTLSRRIAISKGSHLKLCYKKRLVKPAGNFNRLWQIYAFHAENDAKAEISHANYSVLLETSPSGKTLRYRVLVNF